MLTKHDQYARQLSRCMANADHSPAVTRQLWLTLADSYRTLIEYEDRYPTSRDGNAARTSEADEG